MSAPHESPRFRNAVTYTVAVTFTVAGGARPHTAHRRAERIAERITAAATRLRDVVDVHAVVGLAGSHGEVLGPVPVRFSAANTGPGTHTRPDRMARYLDPDHERGLVSLAEANTRDRQRRDADRQRRRTVGCANTWRTGWDPPNACRCVYCAPARHLHTRTGLDSALGVDRPCCLCGQPVPTAGGRCHQHRDTALVVLDRDPPALRQLADHTAAERRRRDRTGPGGRGLDLSELHDE